MVCPRDNETLKITASIEPGLILNGKYKVFSHVGSGGMADVYRVEHLTFHEEMAIKVVRAAFADDESFNHRFKSEAVLTRKLSHPNAISVLDFDITEDGRPFIVMELARGGSLKQLLASRGALPVSEALEIALQVGSALEAAHALGVTHRDIKPDNILITEEHGQRVAKVLDFGIARVKEGAMSAAGLDHTATRTGMVVGTPQYMSPEQAEGKVGDKIDGRADIYSLGVVLYEMLSGDLPFHADTPMGFVLARLSQPPTPMRELREAGRLDAPLRRLVMHALEREPARRFPNMSAMLAALRDPEHWSEESTAREAATRISAMPSEEAATIVKPQGNITAGGDIHAGGTIRAAGNIQAGGRPIQSPAPRRDNEAIAAPLPPSHTTPAPIIIETPKAPRISHVNMLLSIVAALATIFGVGYSVWQSQHNKPSAAATTTQQTQATTPASNSVTPDGSPHAAAKKTSPNTASGGSAPTQTSTSAPAGYIQPSAQSTTASSSAKPQQTQPARVDAPAATNNAAAMPAAATDDVEHGDDEYRNGDYQQAVFYYRRALRLAPSNATIKAKLQQALSKTN